MQGEKNFFREHLDFPAEEIENNSRITLNQLKISLHAKSGISVSTECVKMHLVGLLYTLKGKPYGK